jgi:mRNA-degrading endonuclease YafQ of YafQ-DinJ toxin-antitoxin module
MKMVISTGQFRRHYKERIAQNEPLVKRFQDSLQTFLYDPASVRVHSLTDKMAGKFAFDVAPDCRVVFRENEEQVILVDIGTHEQVYER